MWGDLVGWEGRNHNHTWVNACCLCWCVVQNITAMLIPLPSMLKEINYNMSEPKQFYVNKRISVTSDRSMGMCFLLVIHISLRTTFMHFVTNKLAFCFSKTELLNCHALAGAILFSSVSFTKCISLSVLTTEPE